MRGCVKRIINHGLLFQYQMTGNDNVLPLPSAGPVVADTLSLILTTSPHYLLIFPENQVGLEKEECVVFTVLTLDSECSDDMTILHFWTLL